MNVKRTESLVACASSDSVSAHAHRVKRNVVHCILCTHIATIDCSCSRYYSLCRVGVKSS